MREVDAGRWAQLSALLDELLDLDGAARDARIAGIAHDDRTLAGELDALLAQQGAIESERFLDGSALGDRCPTLAGRTLGAYTLERPLGAGGTGRAWLARRRDGRYDARVTVQVLNLAPLGHGGAERFAREGSALARLAHPHIARLLDAGVADGRPYLVLEHVEGEPIDAWCAQRALSVRARVHLVLDVLAAVAHAHARGVLHRALRPARILVTPAGQVKLLDFGIAALFDGDDGASARIGRRTCTPDFAAPEQVDGGALGTATDVYALGVLLYRLLGGGHPTMRAEHTPTRRLRSIVEDEPRRLSEAAATVAGGATLVRALRGDLDAIVAKALKKDPAERYATADAFAADLRRFLADEPVAARPDRLGYRAVKFVRRHRGALAAAALAALALVGVGT